MIRSSKLIVRSLMVHRKLKICFLIASIWIKTEPAATARRCGAEPVPMEGLNAVRPASLHTTHGYY